MSDMRDFTARYIYLHDEDCFYDKIYRRRVPRELMMKNATKVSDTPASLLKEIQDLCSYTLAEYQATSKKRKKNEAADSIKQVYSALAPHLPIRRYADALSPLLYTIDTNSQVSYGGPADAEQWKNLVASMPELVARIRDLQNTYAPEVELAALVPQLYRHFEFDAQFVLREPPPALSWTKETPAFRVLNESVLKPGPHPTWDEFLARCTFAPTIRAYIWSIFEPTNFGRQALWLQGEGGDGKSTVLRVLARFMGADHTLTIGLGTYDNDFFYGAAYGKRLALYPDCKNLSVLRKEKIKSLLGRDIVQINNKYEKPFSAQVYSKLVIGSNWMPQINYNDDSERTRLLVAKVRTYGDEFGDPDFEDKLYSEMGAFLLTCKKDYAEQCPRGMNLIVPPAMRDSIRSECAALDGVLLQKYIEECLTFGPTFEVEKAVLYSSLKTHFMHYFSGGDVAFAFNDLGRMLSKRGVSAVQDAGNAIYKGVQLKQNTSTNVLKLKP